MDFTKFISMLEHKGLFFSRADLLGDPFEGTNPKLNVEMQNAIFDQWGLSSQQRAQLNKGHVQWRKWVVVNCWHMNEHESAAMWNLYAKTNEAIAICSTYQQLRNALDQTCYVGKVNYIDYDSAFVGIGNMFHRFLSKRLSFSHESELRAVILEPPPLIHTAEGNLPDCDRKSGGTWKSVDLQRLIDEVRVAPTSPSWFKELVEQVVLRYSLNKPVKQSRLDDAPFE